ncbi:MAG: serine/threonine-protein kinase [Acidobacteriota bacterium]
MDPQRWELIEALFHAALEREAAERGRFLDEACRGDAGLRSELDSLIASHEDSTRFLAKPVAEDAVMLMSSSAKTLGEGHAIGPYKIIREIGHGGMGSVYLAARADDQYQMQVAIKVVRPGMDSEFLLHRFHTERQILASLDHPNIARLLDGGRTADGRPYLVMEYVEGRPIDAYCREHHLSIPDRLSLFRVVCSAVHYAHQHLVVHRDIKHGNILVTREGVPKLLDFGIAKLLNPDPSKTAGATAPGQQLMTLDYASPEQLRGENITTVSDVYSLGVLLYRLLTGRPPYILKGRRFDEVLRSICIEDPARPSAAVIEPGSAADPSATVGAGPQVEAEYAEPPEKLRRLLEGDLDNIVLMAMRKEPRRRYATVEQFSDDLRRHQVGLPVIAREDTFRYRAGKFVLRHKVGVAAAGLVLLSLVGGIVATAWQARIAASERDRTRVEAQKAEQINAFVQDMLSSADPRYRGKDVTVAEVLDEAAQRAKTELRGQPEIQAAVRTTIGLTYMSLGLYEQAERQLRDALDARMTLFGRENGDTAMSMNNLGMLLESKGDVAGAEPLYRGALAVLRKVRGDRDLEVASVLNNLAGLMVLKGDLGAAERLHREEIDIRRSLLPHDHADIAQSLNDLAVVLGTKGDYVAAEPLNREALDILRKVRGPEHPDVSSALSTLATVVGAQKNYAEAEQLYQQALDLRRKVLGKDHPDVAWLLYNYGFTMFEKGDYVKAADLSRQVLEMRGRSLPDGHPMIASALQVLGRSLLEQGDAAAAEPLLLESLDLRRKAMPPGHWLIANSESVLGECLWRLGRLSDAEPLLVSGYENLHAELGDKHERTQDAIRRLVRMYEASQRQDQAARYRSLLDQPESGGH